MLRWGCNLFGNRTGGGTVWIYRHRCGRGGNCEVSLLSLPGDLPDFFIIGISAGRRNTVTQASVLRLPVSDPGRVPDGQNRLEVCATALVTAPEWIRAARERDASADGDLRFVAT